MTANALIVDDEADLCRLMQMTLTKMGLKSDVAYTLADAFELLKNNHYDFCLTDLALPDGSGLDLVKAVVADNKMPIAIITAHGTVDLAIDALKMGAFDFVNKPLELSRLRQLVTNVLKARDTTTQTHLSADDALLDARLIGTSTPMITLKNTIKKLAKSQAPVFLSGESGTGKEVVARLIHDLSPRKDGNFVPVNCGAIPSELMESEFFGHKKGSFTGATTDKIGLFQQASGGTLFLDEVADLPLAMQVKLLRAIQEKTVRAVGDTKEVAVDIRLLSATHKDLTALVQTGQFRQDLFYRINVIMLKLPTLNDRRADIPLLAEHFLAMIAKDWGIDEPSLSDNALSSLKQHNFAGNVRELRNLLERAITMAEGNTIDDKHLFANGGYNDGISHHTNNDLNNNLSSNLTNNNANNNNLTNHSINAHSVSSTHSITPSYQSGIATNINPSTVKVSLNYHNKADHTTYNHTTYNQIEQTKTPHQSSKFSNNPDDIPPKLPKEGLENYLQNQEKTLIVTALAQTDGNKTKAAKLLGMSFRSLRYRMKKLEIDDNIDDGDDDE